MAAPGGPLASVSILSLIDRCCCCVRTPGPLPAAAPLPDLISPLSGRLKCGDDTEIGRAKTQLPTKRGEPLLEFPCLLALLHLQVHIENPGQENSLGFHSPGGPAQPRVWGKLCRWARDGLRAGDSIGWPREKRPQCQGPCGPLFSPTEMRSPLLQGTQCHPAEMRTPHHSQNSQNSLG